MSENLDFCALFAQLQSRYPAASLVTELVQIQSDRPIVRALVQVNGFTLVTAMAIATTIEAAEDQARLRVLRILGISLPDYATLPDAATSPPDSPALSVDSPAALPWVAESASSDLEESSLPTVPPQTASSFDFASPFDQVNGNSSALHPAIANSSLLDRSVSSSDIDSFATNKSISQAVVPKPSLDLEEVPEVNHSSLREPIDLSELIALSDVEMERIGWSKKRGQNHLKRTYGKQTRAELGEEQLLDFLHFLRALPSQSEASDD